MATSKPKPRKCWKIVYDDGTVYHVWAHEVSLNWNENHARFFVNYPERPYPSNLELVHIQFLDSVTAISQVANKKGSKKKVDTPMVVQPTFTNLKFTGNTVTALK